MMGTARSGGRYEPPGTPKRGVIRVDGGQLTIVYNERRAKLTKQQTLILSILARRREVVPYEELTRAIDPNARLANARRVVASQISQIRRLLSDAGIPLSILTVQHRGYYLEPDIELTGNAR